MTPEQLTLAMLEMLRHHFTTKIRRRAEDYSKAAEDALFEAEQFWEIATRVMSYVSGVTPPATPEIEPATQDKRERDAPAQMAYFRAVGDCGQPHSNLEEAFACTQSRQARGLPLSEADQQIMESLKASLSSHAPLAADSAKSRRRVRLMPVPSMFRKDEPFEVTRRPVEPGPFAPSLTEDGQAGPPVVGIEPGEAT
jgi:hypothetical protein